MKNIKKFVTHAGIFHADDVFATAWLARHFGMEIGPKNFHRVKTVDDNDINSPDVIVYDIGGILSAEKMVFDHHQREGKPVRDEYEKFEGLPYSSFGLVFQFFNNLSDFVSDRLLEKLVIPIDAVDNGIGGKNEDDIPSYSLSQVISLFNPLNAEEGTDEEFFEAVELASKILNKEIALVEKQEQDFNNVITSPIYEGKILVMEKCYSGWQRAILETPTMDGILYVIYPGLRGGYQVQAVPDKLGSFGMRKGLPEKWRGQRSKELSDTVGIPDAIFCHPGGFVGGAESLESAKKMAKMACDI